MAYIKKEIRIRVWNKYDKHCAYCGVDLEYKKMQVDHIDNYWHADSKEYLEERGMTKGAHEESNFNPSCARCNRWKGTFTIEQFRKEISLQLDRLHRDSSNYRMAFDYGMIQENRKPIKFYFEKYNDETLN